MGRVINAEMSFARSHIFIFAFQIEREVVLSSGDKNSKIPILHEYKKRPTGRVAIAPDAPVKQQAWTQEVNCGSMGQLYIFIKNPAIFLRL